jgi:hypothetical protein
VGITDHPFSPIEGPPARAKSEEAPEAPQHKIARPDDRKTTRSIEAVI